MEVPWVLLCCLLGLLCQAPTTILAADILVLTPFGSRSVRGLFNVLTEGLASRGHRVTVVSSGDPTPRHTNVTHLLAPHSGLDQMDLFEVREGGHPFRIFQKAFPAVTRQLYSDPQIMALWHRRHEFDAIIVNAAANEMAFPFLLDLSVPFITLAPAGTEPIQLSYLGNIVSPAALPSVIMPYDNTLTLWERLANTLATVLLRYSFRRTIGAPLTVALRESFPDLPDIFSMYPKQSLALLNRHHLLDGAVPLLPNQVEVGCMHCHFPRPLPHDVGDWLDGAGDAGVVYFSLGSYQKSSRMPQRYKDALFQAFGRLPHRVILKYSGEDVQLPPNVRAFPWLPQQDVLGHKSVRVFVTHCGKHSASEAMYHGVPMLGLPITFDQPRTCARIARREEGIVLQWEELTPDVVVDAIYKLINEKKYSTRVKGVSKRLKAQKETGLDRAIWWVEYVIEHGNDYLKFSGADLSLAQYLLLDVFAIIGGVLLVIAIILFFMIRSIYRRFCPTFLAKSKLD